MGLDMYFYAEKEEYKSYHTFYGKKEDLVDETDYPKDLQELAEHSLETNFKSAVIEKRYQIGYFRKFNALHSYIISSIARGEDKCQSIYLEKSDLETLLEVCKEVSADHSKAEELLPTASGFFFGSTGYDEWYFNQVDSAIKLFELILETVDFDTYDVIYQASW